MAVYSGPKHVVAMGLRRRRGNPGRVPHRAREVVIVGILRLVQNREAHDPEVHVRCPLTLAASMIHREN